MFQGTNHPGPRENWDGEWDGEWDEPIEGNKCSTCRENTASTNCVILKCKDCCEQERAGAFCPRHELRRPLKASKEVKFSTSLKMLPPWMEYPEYPRYDIGWRMGSGEDYIYKFRQEFIKLSYKEQKWYAQDFPDTGDWMGFYNDIINDEEEES